MALLVSARTKSVKNAGCQLVTGSAKLTLELRGRASRLAQASDGLLGDDLLAGRALALVVGLPTASGGNAAQETLDGASRDGAQLGRRDAGHSDDDGDGGETHCRGCCGEGWFVREGLEITLEVMRQGE